MAKTKNKDPDLFDFAENAISEQKGQAPVTKQHASFNLIDEKWIPVADSSERKSLKDIFSDRTLKRLSGNSVDKIAVFRLLLAIAHASTDIPDDEAWLSLNDEIIGQNALTYLERWHDRFDLFGDKPFMQFPQLAEKGKKDSFASLQVEVSTGNKVVLSNWNSERKQNVPEQAVLLLRSSFMGCGGKKYDNSVSLSAEYSKKATGRAGALLGFAGYLHSYVLGDTILNSVYYNLLSEEEIKDTNAFPSGKGIPCWESMPTGEKDLRALEYSKSYQGELLPLDKFLLIQDEKVIKTDGIVYPGHKEGFVDPAVTIHTKGKDVKAEWVRTEIHPWRTLPSILMFLESDQIKSPLFIRSGKSKLLQKGISVIGLWVGGISVSSNAGEQYVSGTDDYVESEFSFPVSSMNTTEYQRFQKIMAELDAESKVTYASVLGYFKELNSDSSAKMASKAGVAFWEKMTLRSSEIITIAFPQERTSDDDFCSAFTHEIQIWHQIIKDVYAASCSNDTPRQMTAWVNHYPHFSNSNKKSKEKS